MAEQVLHLSEFDFDLPQQLIAQYPLFVRDQARLMVVDRIRQRIEHDVFAHVDKYLPAQSAIILNDSKVIPARLWGHREKSNGRVEILLLKRLADRYSYEALIRPLGRLRLNEKIQLNNGSLTAQLMDIKKQIVRFNRKDVLQQLGHYADMPLPPYIRRSPEPLDHEYYQTVYARRPGSVAAPTAGLHFTPDLLRRLRRQRHTLVTVTLHINHATFRPVKEEDITRHAMHTEEYLVTKKNQRTIDQAKASGQKIVAVGTTSCRVLETLARDDAKGTRKGQTNIFIYPGYQFQAADCLITNFHLPRSTLLMLVYAFGGKELMRRAYAQAIEHKYRFFSYGDAMIIL